MAGIHTKLRSKLAISVLLSLAAASAAALPNNIPFKQAAPDDDNLIYRAIAAFLVACAAAYAIAWLVKRYAPGIRSTKAPNQQLQRLEAIRVTQRTTLLRIRWGNEELLIGENEHSVSLLGKRPLAEAETTGTPSPETRKP
ncbi:MAG TPA: flagellar biosynthetic protein FliO [Burkholderiaceae bacterium]